MHFVNKQCIFTTIGVCLVSSGLILAIFWMEIFQAILATVWTEHMLYYDDFRIFEIFFLHILGIGAEARIEELPNVEKATNYSKF